MLFECLHWFLDVTVELTGPCDLSCDTKILLVTFIQGAITDDSVAITSVSGT